ncbi:Yip1 family protein [Streptacidiphilus sp. EB129]|uniref:Yip1 family protein n=1 Tax=Streptacidiphilus sp. EB129 TaxID=3156262 RepID=UPI0035192CC5
MPAGEVPPGGGAGVAVSEERITTYRAGQPHPRVGSSRLAWRPLLAGMFRHPTRTFAQMRGHQVWAPALIVSAVYGALVVFGFGTSRDQVVHSTFSLALTILVSSAVGIILAGLMFGAVTHALARQLGGDGAWAPTIGFAMLIAWTTDAPRLLFSFFLPSGNGFVQLLGWGTWLLCAWLLTAMVRQLHDLPWGKAAAAAAIQLLALLIVIKLPILG